MLDSTAHLRAIMFADVAGSSALYKQMSDTAAKTLIDRAVAMMREVTETFDGFVVKTIGDEALSCFPGAESAARAAIAVQERSPYLSAEHPIAIRIGIAFGPVLHEGGDVFGETVNDAAYVSHIARGRQIVATEALVAAVPPDWRTRFERFDHVPLKGARADSTLYRLAWEGRDQLAAAATRLNSGNLVLPGSSLRLTLAMGSRNWVVAPEATPFRIGRDPEAAHLHVDASHASREHCHIHFRRGKYVLADHSTNGTYVRPDGQPEVFLRREDLQLVGSGTISLGRPSAVIGVHAVRYRVEG